MSNYPTNKWFRPTPEQIEQIIEDTKGRGGKQDESVVLDSGFDREAGVVQFHGQHGSTASKILKRCPKAIRRLHIICTRDGAFDSMDIDVDRSAFRGLEYCFKLAQ